MIFVRSVIYFISMVAILPNNVVTNNDIDPDYGKRVKLMNMEYGEILSSFENGEWTPKESRKMLRQAQKVKMTHRMTGDVKTVTTRLFSTKCTTDRPIIMDKNYLPDTKEEKSVDIQEHESGDNKETSMHQEKKSLENESKNEPENKSIRDSEAGPDEPEVNTIGEADEAENNSKVEDEAEVEEPENNSIGDNKAVTDEAQENSNGEKEAEVDEPEKNSNEENIAEVEEPDNNSIGENKAEMDGSDHEQEDRKQEIVEATLWCSNKGKLVVATITSVPKEMVEKKKEKEKVQQTKKKIYIPPRQRKSPDHYIDDT